jgi:methylated-DNA-[protein]-cysteine S-methyltransferase
MTDRIDDLLTAHFDPAACAAGIAGAALVAAARRQATTVRDARELAARFGIVATERGIARLELRRAGVPPGQGGARGSGAGAPPRESGRGTRGAERLVEHARRELAEYLEGRRAFFSVPVDLTGVPEFQAGVLAEAARIPFGETRSYSELAGRIGHPAAARAVGNALGANPVPILVPCHRVIRGDGTWGHYAFGGALKTRLLTLERATPLYVGCTRTRIVCRRGCPAEQRVRDDGRVSFASVPDARSVGYRACRVCRPR